MLIKEQLFRSDIAMSVKTLLNLNVTKFDPTPVGDHIKGVLLHIFNGWSRNY